ncbi:MarR family transcriptional regulator [Streptomyces sp. A1-5]|uniref:MarR family transcriptional regulator n=1 Tax=Streptomyces sp. A1-5 TaxID=2738410 RepID=UPI001F424605|nr:MarR family transcriptional regulator [Streptomyces sp. A1-5]
MATRPPPAPDQPEDPAELAGRLRQVLQQLVPLLRGQSPHPDLTPSRLAALAELAAHGPLRIGELAARMNITLSTTSRMVDLLDGSGWITRPPRPRRPARQSDQPERRRVGAAGRRTAGDRRRARRGTRPPRPRPTASATRRPAGPGGTDRGAAPPARPASARQRPAVTSARSGPPGG